MYVSIKTGLLVIALIVFQNSFISAQENNLEVRFDSRLESILILNMDPEAIVEFGIREINDQLYQITKTPEDINFSVESTGSWNLSISAVEPYFTGTNDSSQKIPVDFIGFYIENRGTNWDNGLFSNIANLTRDTVLSMSADRITVLTNGKRGNIGGADKNSFVLRWKFNYEDEAAKIKKFTGMKIKDDYYSGKFFITLSESQVPWKSE